MPRISRPLVVLLLMPVAWVRAQGAGVVFDHQPMPVGGGAADSDFLDMFGNPSWQILADDVTLTQDATIQRLVWWGFYDRDNPPVSESFRMRIYAPRSTDGLPGAVLFEEQFVDPLRVDTGNIVFVGIFPREFRFSVDLATPLPLTANTPYWLEISQIGDRDTHYRWEFSQNAELNGFAFQNPLEPNWTNTSFVSDVAFQLSTVPEPSTLMLFILAAAPIGRRFRACRMPQVS
ncbi:MAG: hypothetical protein V3T70_08675 [Phycisphaerae bacterium]